MRISDWSSDVCSSDLNQLVGDVQHLFVAAAARAVFAVDHQGRSAADAGADHELLAALDLGVGREAAHVGQEALRIGAVFGVEQIGKASWRERVRQYV